jgi:hypothetical protein
MVHQYAKNPQIFTALARLQDYFLCLQGKDEPILLNIFRDPLIWIECFFNSLIRCHQEMELGKQIKIDIHAQTHTT